MPKNRDNIPIGWICDSFFNFAPLQRGFDLPMQSIDKGVVPVVGSNGIIGLHNIAKVKAPGVVTGRSGTIGKVFYIEQDFWPHNTSLWVTDFKGNHPKYVYHFISYFDLTRFDAGSGVPTLNRNDVHSNKILIPPIEEQRRIAEVLGCWDEGIEKLEKVIALKEKQKRALMQRLLSARTRLKGFSEPWKEVCLGEVLSEHGKKSSGKEIVYSVSVHKGIVNQIEHLGRSFSAKNTSNYNLVHPYDIIYTKSPTGDFPYGIIKQSYANTNVIVSPLYGVFTPKTKELGVILDHILESPISANNLLSPIIQKGAKNTINITNKTFLKGRIKIPSDIQEVKYLATYIVTARQELNLLKRKCALFKKQKKWLMQQLLTGKKRLV